MPDCGKGLSVWFDKELWLNADVMWNAGVCAGYCCIVQRQWVCLRCGRDWDEGRDVCWCCCRLSIVYWALRWLYGRRKETLVISHQQI